MYVLYADPSIMYADDWEVRWQFGTACRDFILVQQSPLVYIHTKYTKYTEYTDYTEYTEYIKYTEYTKLTEYTENK